MKCGSFLSPGWIFQFSCLNELEVFVTNHNKNRSKKYDFVSCTKFTTAQVKKSFFLPGGLQSRFSSNLIKSDSSNIPNRDMISLPFSFFSKRLHILHSSNAIFISQNVKKMALTCSCGCCSCRGHIIFLYLE